ncbi:nicotinamide N-methyltransferase-like [Rhinoderma darwinii]|uniref:nicotinamide N-methyltransferase-like n=1 Tax=Rhinoderma darwinii TaxID=43563 RepID=UPI003F6697DA
MAIPFTTQQTYIDEFNPKDYLQTFYVAGEGVHTGEWTDFVSQHLHETFTKDGVRGDTLLDVGTGPSIYHLLSACEVFDKIIASDLVEQNRAEFQKWLKKDPDAFDWTHIIKFVCELEGNRESSEEKAEKLRSKVTEVLKCDVMKRNPYDPVVLPPVDCLLCCLWLECACPDMKSYCNVLKNFKNLIKPGGHLLILSVMNGTFYHVGEKYFRPLTTRKDDVEMAFIEAGYHIERAVYMPRINKSRMDVGDYDSKYFIHARKPQ